MLKNLICFLAILSCFNSICYSMVSGVKSNQQTTTEIKDTVNKIGVNGRIKFVTLTDGRKLKGWIKEIKSDSFILVDGAKLVGSKIVAEDKTNSALEIQFTQIKEIKAYRNIPGAVLGGIIIGAAGLGILALISLAGRN